MSLIRVHLGPMPEMLRAIVGELLRQEPDIVVAGESARHEESLMIARTQGADVLITQDGTPSDGSCLDFILADAPIGVFALSADGRSAAGVCICKREISVELEGRSTIVESIRDMAREIGLSVTGSDAG